MRAAVGRVVLMRDVEAEPLVVRHVPGLAGLEERRHSFGTSAVDAVTDERAPDALTLARRLDADNVEEPMRLRRQE